MLEDDFTYVVRKAFKGLALTPGEAAVRSGLTENEILAFSRGRFSAETARKLAPVLHLNAPALASHPNYQPRPLLLPNIHRIDLPFGEDRVNAWLVWEKGDAVLFDTGDKPGTCAVALDAISPPPLKQVFITHGHRDHIAGIPDFKARGIMPLGAEIPGAVAIQAGASIRCGALIVTAYDLSGHANPSLGYLIGGLQRPVLVTGDAVFAGSIGGCASPPLYQHALRRIRETFAPLPDETLLLPGHGPATTLGEERVSNPFL